MSNEFEIVLEGLDIVNNLKSVYINICLPHASVEYQRAFMEVSLVIATGSLEKNEFLIYKDIDDHIFLILLQELSPDVKNAKFVVV